MVWLGFEVCDLRLPHLERWMVWQWIALETALGRPWGRHELRQISQLLGLRMGLVLGVMVWNLRQMGL
jgi:hypothetical protein